MAVILHDLLLFSCLAAFVTGIVDVGGDFRGALGCDQEAVVVGGGVGVDEHLFRHSGLQGPAGV